MEEEIINQLVETLKRRLSDKEFTELVLDVYKKYGYSIVPIFANEDSK